MPAKPVVHIIDDDPAIRDSLAFLLDVHGFEPRVHESAVAFLGSLDRGTIDCVVTDIRMPDLNGLELVQRMKSEHMTCPVIVITGHGDVALAVEAMKAGVVDFIEKPFSDEALLSAIRTALEGSLEAVATGKSRQQAEQRLAELSPRERDVLAGLVAGKINKVIAYELGISPRTVEVYRANLMAKTQARSMSELMRLALAAGL
jgi:two-component system, LuxR family, response regulator FixJ